MNLARLSVVLPCFNAAASLGAAIGSIRAQTFPDWELIVCDDGSTDGSRDVAERAARADGRIRVVAAEHAGIVAALQRGCAEARGDLVARMDADDTAHPTRLEKQLDLMDQDPDIALCGTQVHMAGPRLGYGRRRYQAWINVLITHEEMVRELFVECPVPHPTFLMRKTALETAGGYQDNGWAEDYDLCMRLWMKGLRLGKVAEPLLDWGEAPGRLSMTDARYSPGQFRALKRHYLFASYLKRDRTFFQWGAGEVGKVWLREWGAQRPVAAIDINPRKIGRVIHGVQVVSPEALPVPGNAFAVVAVGAPGAREEIRAWFGSRGYVELRDFLFLA